MATVRDVIQKALVKLGVLRANGSMAAEDAGSGLSSLVSWYAECVAQGSFGRVTSVIQTSDAVAYPGQHINNVSDDPFTVTLPDTLATWGWWWPMDPMVPPDLSVVRTTDKTSARRTFLYDGTIQRWVRIDELGLNDEAPLSARGGDGLAAVLAIRLAEEYGDNLISPLTDRQARTFKAALVTGHGIGDHYPFPAHDYGFGYLDR